jgi:hypothetical protein
MRNIAPSATLGQPKPQPVMLEVRYPPDSSKTRAEMPPIAGSLGAKLAQIRASLWPRTFYMSFYFSAHSFSRSLLKMPFSQRVKL